MFKEKRHSQILAGILVVGLLITSGSFALASDASSDASPNPGIGFVFGFGDRAGKDGHNLQEVLAQLVEDSVITQDQVDDFNDLMAEKKAEMAKYRSAAPSSGSDDNEQPAPPKENGAMRGPGKAPGLNLLDEAVSAGIFDEEDAAAIREAVHNSASAQAQERQQQWVDELVEADLITAEEGEAILEYLTTMGEQRQAEMEKIKDMTEEERRAYFKEDQNGRTDMFAALTEADVITEEQVQDIQSYLHSKAAAQQQEETAAQLAKLVAAGTIDEEESEAIAAYLKKEQQERQAEMEKIRAMTEAERQAYLEENRPDRPNRDDMQNMTEAERQQMKADRPNPFQALVEDGTLTQDQAEAVAKVLTGRHR